MLKLQLPMCSVLFAVVSTLPLRQTEFRMSAETSADTKSYYRPTPPDQRYPSHPQLVVGYISPPSAVQYPSHPRGERYERVDPYFD